MANTMAIRSYKVLSSKQEEKKAMTLRDRLSNYMEENAPCFALALASMSMGGSQYGFIKYVLPALRK